nr:MAG TPA: hypothetical protein [Caudoviricetes sp.]
MAVVVEASALCWGFFCVIRVLVLRIAFIGRRRPFMGGFLFCKKLNFFTKVLTFYSICTIMYIESKRGK